MEQLFGDEITERVLEKLVDCQRQVLLGRLSSGLTHEINNQLAGVLGYVQLLLGQERSQPVSRELEKINSSANECKRLVSNFKRFAAPGNHEKEYGSLNLIVQQAMDFFRRQFSKKDLCLVENYAPELPVIEIDAVALEHVFLNVVQNALDALQEAGSRFSVATGRDGGYLTVVFEDDGPGLTPEARMHLFVPFFTTKHHLHCAGLGLVAAKMLLDKSGGKISVEALPQAGTRVTIGVCVDESGHEREE